MPCFACLEVFRYGLLYVDSIPSLCNSRMVLIHIHSIKAYIMGILLLLFIIANFIMQAVRRHRLQMTFYETDQHSSSNVRMYAIAMYALQGVGLFLIKEYLKKPKKQLCAQSCPTC